MQIDQNSLKDIIKVHQEHDANETNKFLELGWILLNVHTTDYGHPVERHQNTIFTLGWSKNNGETKYPEVKADKYDLNQFVRG